ncbi:MAG: T9SS type A sorting domain-containing protein [Bacteroidetes bacterium]|nr:T9SS type A sorting domain-containing protein [Bacteroidota bacterium]
MKKILLFSFALVIALGSFAQYRNLVKKYPKAVALLTLGSATGVDLPVAGSQPSSSYTSNKSVLDDPVTMITRYDVQSNGAAPRRCYRYPDGTIGTAATWSSQDASWTDRGTGYNYFDGGTWGALPASRVETVRTGWPNYCPFGTAGELIIAHEASGPLVMNTRTVKGTGAWTQTLLPALPTTIPMMFWSKAVTSGPSHTYIHVIALTGPTANGGLVYNGMNGALVYSRSLDGGTTWSNWTQPTDLTSTNYTAFGSDTYCWAEPRGDTLAFTLGSGFYDQLLLKSTDNGATWTKTVIWHSLYNLGGSSPGWFYAPDGTSAITLDGRGMAHVVFGLTYDSGTNTSWYYNIMAQGVVYWNESQPTLRQDLDPDSLFASGNLVGWVQDTNVFNLPANQISYWGKSLTSFPNLVWDSCKSATENYERLYVIFSGATSLLDANNYNLRHIYGRGAYLSQTGLSWLADTLADITGDWIQYNFSECMYPSTAPRFRSEGEIPILFQKDDYGGSYVLSTLATGTWQGQTSPDDNSLTLIKWTKPGVPCGYQEVIEKPGQPTLSVSQNVPNPFSGQTEINVYHQNPGNIGLVVTNLTGQNVLYLEKTNVLPGVSQFTLDGSTLAPGVYFYTVTQGAGRITKKMIVQ